MSRTPIPYSTSDISALAKSLRVQLAGRTTAPSHVQLLNMLARATGHRNFQHLRAQASQTPGVAAARVEPANAEPLDSALAERAVRYFDDQGRLASWPARTRIQNLCLWALWARLPARRVANEREINTLLDALHLSGDPPILRRTMCQLGLMTRTLDGREYRRVEREPPSDAAALIARIKVRAQLRA